MADVEKKKLIADSIRGIPDFPKPGILFWDVTTLMLDPAAFQASIDLFVERYRGMDITTVAGTAVSMWHL
jgi:adenine phosphoribosyltransferase